MTWTRLDDTWTDQPVMGDLAFDVRWHYLAMIQFCSRTQRYDGMLKMSDARRCSDVDDPAQAIQALVSSELLTLIPDGMVKVGRIDEHIPPPGVRENSAKTKVRMQRHRKHKNGDHSECLPENCDQLTEETVDTATGEVTRHVTGGVTRNTRTGQDGTGQDYRNVTESVSERDTTAENEDLDDLEAQMVEEQSIDPDPDGVDPNFDWYGHLGRSA